MPQAHCFSKDPFLSTPSSSSSPSAALSAPLSLPKAQKQPQPPRFRSCSHSSSNCNTSSLDSSLSSTQVVNSLERIIYNKDGTKKLSLVPPSGKGSNELADSPQESKSCPSVPSTIPAETICLEKDFSGDLKVERPGVDNFEARKKRRKKRKPLNLSSSELPSISSPSIASSEACNDRAMAKISSPVNEGLWSNNSLEERQRIREFWINLDTEERRSLVRAEKEAVLKKLKDQQRHSCSCNVCGRKRAAIEEELEILYEAYYDELEHYVHQQRLQQQFCPDLRNNATLLPPNLVPAEGELYDTLAFDQKQAELYEEEEEVDDEGGSCSPSENSDVRHSYFNFGSHLKGKGGILTVADDLLKNDGRAFLEMMEKLAERRMRREEAAAASMLGNAQDEEEEYDDEEDDDDEYDEEDDDDEYEEEEEEDEYSDEQRMEQGRRMFQIFAARLFEQRVLGAYREKVAKERQLQLLKELEDEEKAQKEREIRKIKEKEKKRDRRKSRKLLLEEQRRAQEETERLEKESKLEEERKKEAEESKRREEERRKREEERRKREEERRKLEVKKLLKEEERKRKIKEDKIRELERIRKEKEAERLRKEAERKEAAAKAKSTIGRKPSMSVSPLEVPTTVCKGSPSSSCVSESSTTCSSSGSISSGLQPSTTLLPTVNIPSRSSIFKHPLMTDSWISEQPPHYYYHHQHSQPSPLMADRPLSVQSSSRSPKTMPFSQISPVGLYCDGRRGNVLETRPTSLLSELNGIPTSDSVDPQAVGVIGASLVPSQPAERAKKTLDIGVSLMKTPRKLENVPVLSTLDSYYTQPYSGSEWLSEDPVKTSRSSLLCNAARLIITKLQESQQRSGYPVDNYFPLALICKLCTDALPGMAFNEQELCDACLLMPNNLGVFKVYRRGNPSTLMISWNPAVLPRPDYLTDAITQLNLASNDRGGATTNKDVKGL